MLVGDDLKFIEVGSHPLWVVPPFLAGILTV